MPTFRPYLPGFVETERPPDVQFQTLRDLLVTEWFVRRTAAPDFYRFEFSEGSKAIMALYDGGHEWYVVGFVDETLNDLPKFNPPKAKKASPPMGYIPGKEELRLKVAGLIGSGCLACGHGTLVVSELDPFILECTSCGATVTPD